MIPSLWPEPLGSVVYEGMSRGKAVIGTTPGGHTDMIVDGVTGLLVPPGDVDALRTAMQTLLDDPELCVRYGQAGQERGRMFTAEVNVPRFEQLYRQLIDTKHTRQSPNGAESKHSIEPVKWHSGIGHMMQRSIRNSLEQRAAARRTTSTGSGRISAHHSIATGMPCSSQP